MESVNGDAFINFSTFLGNPGAPHVNPRKSKMAAARTSGHPEGHHDSQNGGNPHFQATSKKSKRKTERDNARAAEFQKKKRKEAEQAMAAGKEETARKEEEPEASSKEAKEAEEDEESQMTISRRK